MGIMVSRNRVEYSEDSPGVPETYSPENLRPMRRVRSFYCLLQLLGFLLAGCTTGPRPVPAHTQVDAGEPAGLLWHLRSGNHEGWLLGSILPASHEQLPRPIEEALDKASCVVLEVRPEPDHAMKFLQRGRFEPGGDLRRVLSAKAWEELAASLPALGIVPEDVLGLRPWALALSLAARAMQAEGFSPAYGVEERLTRRAKSAGKDLLGLESFDEQVGLLQALPPDLQEAFLLATVRNLPNTATDLRALLAIWLRGDLDALEHHLTTQLQRSPEPRPVFATILTLRSRIMAERILALFGERGGCLVAVGAAHLPGESGVLALLQEHGAILQVLRP